MLEANLEKEDKLFKKSADIFLLVSLVIGLLLFVTWAISRSKLVEMYSFYAAFAFIPTSLFVFTVLGMKMMKNDFRAYIRQFVLLTANYLFILIYTYACSALKTP